MFTEDFNQKIKDGWNKIYVTPFEDMIPVYFESFSIESIGIEDNKLWSPPILTANYTSKIYYDISLKIRFDPSKSNTMKMSMISRAQPDSPIVYVVEDTAEMMDGYNRFKEYINSNALTNG